MASNDKRIVMDKNFTNVFKKTIEDIFGRFKLSFKKTRETVQPLDSVYIYEYEISSGGVPLKMMVNLVGVDDSGWILSSVIRGKEITTMKGKEETNDELPDVRDFLKLLHNVVIEPIENLQKKYGLPLIKKSSRNAVISSKDISSNDNIVRIIIQKVIEGHKPGYIIDDVITAVDNSDMTSEVFSRIPFAISSYADAINSSLNSISSELKKYAIE